MPVKLAHKLSHRVVHPGPIERQSVILTHSVFHESTIEALKFYGHRGRPEFLETASFLEIIMKWWKLVNVKSKFLAQKKRDEWREIINRENLTDKTSFLRAFADWLRAWQESSAGPKFGFSPETFQAAIQTSEGLASLSEYLILEKQQSYVLLGKIQSDRLEGRFGKLRQMAGGNMFASVRQFLESERTLKIQNLASLDLSLSEIRDMFQNGNQEKSIVLEALASEIINSLDLTEMGQKPFNLHENDENSLFYVAGYFSRSIKKGLKCEECQSLLTSSDIAAVNITLEHDPKLTLEENQSRVSYINEVNRGGLVYPSELMFSACLLAWDLYQKIRSKPDLSEKLLQPNISSQRLFSLCFLLYLKSAEATRLQLIHFECLNGHEFSRIMEFLGKKFFNLVSKNFVSQKNSEIHAKKKRPADESESKRISSVLKVKKLQSE